MTARPPRLVARVAALALVGSALAGCGTTQHLAVSHRHSPSSEARIVVLPVETPASAELPPETGEDLAALYVTELLKSYEVLELERFEKTLERHEMTVERLLQEGPDEETAADLDLDGVLLAKVYEWDPGKPGLPFLKKKGRIGLSARLVDVRSGAVIWGINRVVETPPAQPLSVGLSLVFAELVGEMPRNLTPY
jgi:hypothetical protein